MLYDRCSIIFILYYSVVNWRKWWEFNSIFFMKKKVQVHFIFSSAETVPSLSVRDVFGTHSFQSYYSVPVLSFSSKKNIRNLQVLYQTSLVFLQNTPIDSFVYFCCKQSNYNIRWSKWILDDTIFPQKKYCLYPTSNNNGILFPLWTKDDNKYFGCCFSQNKIAYKFCCSEARSVVRLETNFS